MYDLVEWAAEQPWSDGNAGMIGTPELWISRDTKPGSQN
jgi:X-Pro dipeptidyl-peptidase (S15 family)